MFGLIGSGEKLFMQYFNRDVENSFSGTEHRRFASVSVRWTEHSFASEAGYNLTENEQFTNCFIYLFVFVCCLNDFYIKMPCFSMDS